MADFDPKKYLEKNSGTSAPNEEKDSTGFNPKKYLEKNSTPPQKTQATFDPKEYVKANKPPTLAQAGKKAEDADLPEIPQDKTRVSPEYLKRVVEKYEARGLDSGMEVIKTGSGEKDFVVRNIPTIGPATGNETQAKPANWAERGVSWFMGDWVLGKKRSDEIGLADINKKLDNQAKRNVFGDTTAADQFITGFLAPYAELSAGATSMAVGGKPENYLTDSTTEFGRNYKFKWDELTATEKAGYLLGNSLAFIGLGSISKIIKGGLGIAVKKAGQEALVRSSYKGLNRFVGQKIIPQIPTQVAKEVAGRFAGKFIKNAPALATEGFLWGTISSGGNVKEGLKDAILFPLLTPATEVGLEGVSRFVKNTLKGVEPNLPSNIKTTPQATSSAKPSTPTTVLPPAQTLPKPNVNQEIVGIGSQKMEPMFNKQEGKVMDKVLSDEDLTNKFLLTTEPPPGFTTQSYIRGKALVALQKIAISQADKIEKASIINKKIGALKIASQKANDQLTKINNQIKFKMDKFMQKGGGVSDDIFYLQEKPKNVDQLKVSYQTKEFLQERFGKNVESIFRVANSGNYIDIAKTLSEAGLSTKTAIKVADQLTDTLPVLRKKTDIVAQIKLREDKRALLSEIKKLRNDYFKIKERKNNVVDRNLVSNLNSPDYIADVQPNFFKTHSKDEYISNNFYKMANENGLDLSGAGSDFRFKKRYNAFAQTEKWNRVEEATGIPLNQVLLDFQNGVNKQTHMEKILLESTKWPDELEKLKLYKPPNETFGDYGHRIWKNLHYVENGPDGKIRWNPNPTENKIGTIAGSGSKQRKVYPIPPFEGQMPNQSEMDVLFKLREATNIVFKMAKDQGVEMDDFISNYVGIKRKAGEKFLKTKPSSTFVKKKPQDRTGITKERHWGTVPESRLHEYDTNIFTLFPRIVKDGIKEASVGSALEKAKVVDFMLRASGNLNDVAQNFTTYVNRILGIRGEKGNARKAFEKLAEKMAMTDLKENKHWLDHFFKVGAAIKKKYGVGKFENDEMVSLGEDLIRTSVDMSYKSWLGASKWLPLKQLVQSNQVAAAELGQARVMKAQMMVAAHDGTNYLLEKNFLAKKIGGVNPAKKITLPQEYREALERVEMSLYPDDSLNRDITSTPSRWWLKLMSDVTNFIPNKTTLKVFNAQERYNRRTAFVAALMHFDKAAKKGNFKGTFGDLLEIERNMLTDAFEKGGLKQARDVYGLIRSKRSNFFYNMADKPDWFSEGLGQHIPFVTWGINQWMRHIENFRGVFKGDSPQAKKQNLKTLGARLAWGWGSVIALQYALNEKFYSKEVNLGPIGKAEVNTLLPQSAGMMVFTPDEISPTTFFEGLLQGSSFFPINFYKGFLKKDEDKEKRKAKIKKEVKAGGYQEVIKYTSPSAKGLKKNQKLDSYIFPGVRYIRAK